MSIKMFRPPPESIHHLSRDQGSVPAAEHAKNLKPLKKLKQIGFDLQEFQSFHNYKL
jgi:hypothetical protein